MADYNAVALLEDADVLDRIARAIREVLKAGGTVTVSPDTLDRHLVNPVGYPFAVTFDPIDPDKLLNYALTHNRILDVEK